MGNDRVISAGGFVFAIATFVGLMLLLSGTAAGSTTNAEAAEWLSKNGHPSRMIIGAYVMCVGVIAFMVFAAALLQRLRNAEAPHLAVNVAQLAAIAFVVLALAAAVGMALAAYATMSDVEPKPIDSGAMRLSTFGFALWVIPAALAGATFLASVSAAAIASGALPQWLALIGFLFACVALFGIMFLPTLALLVWAMLVAVVTLARGEASTLPRPQVSPA